MLLLAFVLNFSAILFTYKKITLFKEILSFSIPQFSNFIFKQIPLSFLGVLKF